MFRDPEPRPHQPINFVTMHNTPLETLLLSQTLHPNISQIVAVVLMFKDYKIKQ